MFKRMVVVGCHFILWLCFLPCSPSFGEDRLYEGKVKPILRQRCYACHGAIKQESGLRLDTAEFILQGGDSGPAVVANNLGASVLLERIGADSSDERMPPEGQPLNSEEIAVIKQWIQIGAPRPKSESPERSADEHWAFRTIQSPAVPTMHGRDVAGPIDAFLEKSRMAAGVTKGSMLEKSLLLRRLYLDLVGFPPKRVELQEFLDDDRSDAYERVVDRLLASPHYGERWGRHWMDVWRYSDWYGLGAQLRFSQKHIWRWRDWIVESLNDDKGYDQMVVEMLAGDELAPTDSEVVRATGYLARNYYLFNRNTWLDNTIEHTGKAFLGLTLNCARCHDHKYDPISQEDYYRFRAIFEPHQIRLDAVPGVTNLELDGMPRAFDMHPKAPTYLFVRGDAKSPDKTALLSPATPEFFQFAGLEPHPIDLPLQAHWPGGRERVLLDLLEVANDRLTHAIQELAALQSGASKDSGESMQPQRVRIARLRLKAAALYPQLLMESHQADLARLQDAGDATEKAHEANATTSRHALLLADIDLAECELKCLETPDDEKAKSKKIQATKRVAAAKKTVFDGTATYQPIRASRKALEGPDETAASQKAPYPRQSTGRRLALAKWLVDPQNPLTARVAVNHIWTRHFGQPLVESVNDFGRRAREPDQADLLNWLAADFMRNGWSMKRLHRMVVTADAYKLNTSFTMGCANHEKDPNNACYWRRQPMRMESQVVRDSLLLLADRLNCELGGSIIGRQG